MLAPESPIVAVSLLNPFSEKEFQDDKLSIVDVKARDANGDWYIVEMQTTLPAGLRNRLVYYTAGMYYTQMREGDGYRDLSPVISICFLTGSLFRDVAGGHFRFLLYDVAHQLTYGNQLQLHLIELSKYDYVENMISEAEQFDQWAFFLSRADQYEAARLQQLLPEPTFQKATGVLEMISHSDELRLIYDDHAKAAKDHFSALKDARAEGEARGRAEGEARGRAEGEARGRAEGEHIGRIRTLQQLLGRPVAEDAELTKLTLEELDSLAGDLQKELQDRI